jgi:hypothetical protein
MAGQNHKKGMVYGIRFCPSIVLSGFSGMILSRHDSVATGETDSFLEENDLAEFGEYRGTRELQILNRNPHHSHLAGDPTPI